METHALQQLTQQWLFEKSFLERIIGRGLFLARLPDLSQLDFFLWGYLKRI